MTQAVVEIPCANAEELLGHLGRNSNLWAGERHLWAFRGHRDDEYELVPTALRSPPRAPPAHLGYTCTPKIGVQADNGKQIDAEFERVHEFYWSVDAQGLELAGNGDLIRTPRGWRALREDVQSHGWPVDGLLPLLALAQHHRVPTRLLDWTDKPLVAAYFASKGSAEALHGEKYGAKARGRSRKSDSSHFGIWALNLDWIVHTAFPSSANDLSVYVVTAPRASNPNLHAQGGVFTTEHISPRDFLKPVSPRTVNQLVERRWRKLKARAPVMAHFTLPSCESGKVLRLLYQEGVSAATIFPGYQGAADSLTERTLWDQPQRASYWINA